MTFTTGGPPPAGITWQALIFKSFGMSVDPEIVMRNEPDAYFNLAVTPTIGMRPPSRFKLNLSLMIAMAGGTRVPATFGLSVAPQISMRQIPSAKATLAVTPVFSMSGRAPRRSTQINVAVTRTATR